MRDGGAPGVGATQLLAGAGGGDAGQDQQAADDRGQGRVLADEGYRAEYAHGRLEVAAG